MGAKHPTMIDTVPLPLTPDPGPFWLAQTHRRMSSRAGCNREPQVPGSSRRSRYRSDQMHAQVQVQVHNGKIV